MACRFRFQISHRCSTTTQGGESEIESRDEQKHSTYWDKKDSEARIVAVVPDSANEKAKRQKNDREAQHHRRRTAQFHQFKTGTDCRGKEDQIKKRTVGMSQSKKVASQRIIDQRGDAETEQPFSLDRGFSFRTDLDLQGLLLWQLS